MENLFATSKKTIRFKPWIGELGWEIMSWIPFCRLRAQDYEQVIVSGYKGMEPLYNDFVTEYNPHNIEGRGLDYPKMYRVNGVHKQYGKAEQALVKYDILIHARGIRRKANINYKGWDLIAGYLETHKIAWVGGSRDNYEPAAGSDLRGISMQDLVDTISAAKLVVGVSSGIMHLAAACGTDLVVWGDDRTYFSETLERRYKETWNPHNVNVNWITAKDWQPVPAIIINAIEKGLT